jgi:ParB/RepB/Spo0J family partition protein
MITEQLELPYEIITAVMGRKYLRENFAISSKESYKIPIDSLLIRDGFNKRRVYEDMESVVEWIKVNTNDGIVELDPPPMVDVLEDGRIFILRGHRRFKGIQMAISEGLKVNAVVCTPTKELTELDRMADVYTSNMHQSKLKPLEQAEVCFDLKQNFSLSHEAIAKKIGVSRQTVDNLLILASAGDATKQEILNGNLGVSEAIKYIRSLKKADKEAEKAELDANKNPSAAYEPKDALAGDIKELEELEKETDEERDQRLLRENTKREQAREQLLEISDEIKVNPDTLREHIGRKLSEPVLNGAGKMVINKDVILLEEHIDLIWLYAKLCEGDTILVYKKGMEPAAKSVVTVLPGEVEKDRFDSNRDEIKKIQNCIGLADRLETIVNKLDVPEGTKKDVTDIVKWMQFDLAECREYIHKNKQENKRGR